MEGKKGFGELRHVLEKKSGEIAKIGYFTQGYRTRCSTKAQRGGGQRLRPDQPWGIGERKWGKIELPNTRLRTT